MEKTFIFACFFIWNAVQGFKILDMPSEITLFEKHTDYGYITDFKRLFPDGNYSNTSNIKYSEVMHLKHIPNATLTREIVNMLPKDIVELIIMPCKLNDIEENIFTNWNRLKFLSLRVNNLNNSMVTTGNGTFCKTLQWLDLSYNNLINLKFLKTPSEKMTDIKLDGNLLTEFPEELQNFPHLNKISISQNGLEMFSKNLSTFSNVKYLDASTNSLVDMNGMIHFPNLVHLVLDHNLIQVLTIKILSEMKQLEFLSLKENRVNRIETSLDHSQPLSLEYLNLEKNHLKNVPADFLWNFPNLKVLKLNGNNLNNLEEETFTKMNNLETLDISENKFVAINYNRLIPLEKLTYLNIENNHVESIDLASLIISVPSLRRMGLSGNPISCINLREILNINTPRYIEINRYDYYCLSRLKIEGVCCTDRDDPTNSSVSKEFKLKALFENRFRSKTLQENEMK